MYLGKLFISLNNFCTLQDYNGIYYKFITSGDIVCRWTGSKYKPISGW